MVWLRLNPSCPPCPNSPSEHRAPANRGGGNHPGYGVFRIRIVDVAPQPEGVKHLFIICFEKSFISIPMRLKADFMLLQRTPANGPCRHERLYSCDVVTGWRWRSRATLSSFFAAVFPPRVCPHHFSTAATEGISTAGHRTAVLVFPGFPDRLFRRPLSFPCFAESARQATG